MAGPWEKYQQQSGGPVTLGSPTPSYANDEARKSAAEARAAAAARRDEIEFRSKFNPDGTPKPEDAGGSIEYPEMKTREIQAGDNQFTQSALQQLAISSAMNDMIPTGRFNARINNGVQEFPDSWKGKDNQSIAAFQTMDAEAMNLLKPAITLGNPPGTALSSKETDAAKEMEMATKRVPRPQNEPTTNRVLINGMGKQALDRLAYNTFMGKWREQLGSIYTKNGQGKDALSAWQDYQSSSPVYQHTVARPFTDILAEKTRQRRSGSAPRQTPPEWTGLGRGRPTTAPRKAPAGDGAFLGWEK